MSRRRMPTFTRLIPTRHMILGLRLLFPEVSVGGAIREVGDRAIRRPDCGFTPSKSGRIDVTGFRGQLGEWSGLPKSSASAVDPTRFPIGC